LLSSEENARPESIAAIVEYATARGVINPTVTKHKHHFWELRGGGRDRKDWPLVWQVAKELGIKGGAGNSDQTQITHPDKVVLPPKPWTREVSTMLGDQDYPVPGTPAAEATKRYSPSQLKQQKMMEELVGALEILPDVIENLTEYTVESLEPYAQRLILATVVLQQIEAKLYEQYDGGDRLGGDADDDEDTEIFEPMVADELSEADKDMAIAALAGGADGD